MFHQKPYTDSEADNDELEGSIIAPPFSPICDEPFENMFNLEDDGMVLYRQMNMMRK